MKISFRTTSCEQIARLEQMFCPKVRGTQTHLCPLPTFESAHPYPHPFFYASVNLSYLFFFNWNVFPELIFFEVNDRLFILSIFNKFGIFKSKFCQRCQFWVQVHFWLLYVTVNDISVIHVTAHRIPCHRHFLGFFNVPVQAPTRGHSFYGYSEKPTRIGIRRTYSHL